MSGYRNALPQLDRLFLTDGGIETWLVFKEGFDLPCFAAFPLLGTAEGRAALEAYFERHLRIAQERDTGFILESPTWRASADWGARIGYDKAALARINADAVEMMCELRRRHEHPNRQIIVSGCVGPRGDGYVAGKAMSPDEVADFHAAQIDVFAGSAADMVTAMTMTNAPEAMGVARAAQAHAIPAAISFTVETDGRLPSGDWLQDAIEAVDDDAPGAVPYFMINCAHPSHFEDALANAGDWAGRIRGLRCNASKCSHAELDSAETLDEGDPAELGADYLRLARLLPNLSVVGGCCGTDHRHVAEIARQLGAAGKSAGANAA